MLCAFIKGMRTHCVWTGLAFGIVLSRSVAAGAGELRVVIDDVASPSGTIIVGLYDRQEHYEKAVSETSTVRVNDSERLIGVSLKADPGRQHVVFPNLKPGRYVVVVFHDENDDAKLNKNPLGLPTEAYAFSNNARGLLSPPNFDDAAVVLGDETKTIEITMIYPRQSLERP